MYEMAGERSVVSLVNVSAPPPEEHDLAFPGIAPEWVWEIVAEVEILTVWDSHRGVFLYEEEEIAHAIEGQKEAESDEVEILDD